MALPALMQQAAGLAAAFRGLPGMAHLPDSVVETIAGLLNERDR